jgi:hypothetical protein
MSRDRSSDGFVPFSLHICRRKTKCQPRNDILILTHFPVFGFILAVPVLALAIYIFRLHLSDQCEIDFPE